MKRNNFFIIAETTLTQYRNPFNHRPIENKFESVDDMIVVSNCLVTITLHKDGRFEVVPNERNLDKELLLRRVK